MALGSSAPGVQVGCVLYLSKTGYLPERNEEFVVFIRIFRCRGAGTAISTDSDLPGFEANREAWKL